MHGALETGKKEPLQKRGGKLSSEKLQILGRGKSQKKEDPERRGEKRERKGGKRIFLSRRKAHSERVKFVQEKKKILTDIRKERGSH